MKSKTKIKRLLAVILSIVMVVSAVPFGLSAGAVDGYVDEETGYVYPEEVVKYLKEGYAVWKKESKDENNHEITLYKEGFALVKVTAPHEFDKEKEVETKKADCTQAGEVKKTCSFCKGEYTFEVPSTGHDKTKLNAKAVTCTEAGNIDCYFCNNCKKYFNEQGEEIPETQVFTQPQGHQFSSDNVIRVEPTDEADGYIEQYCDVCKKMIKTTLHNLEEVPEVKPVCGESDGMQAHWKCTNCKKLFSDPNGETEVNEKDIVIPKDNGHNIVEVPAVAGMCGVRNAVQAHWECTNCKRLFSNREGTEETDIEKLTVDLIHQSHTYLRNVVEPTCDTDGYTEYKCSNCGHTYQDDDERVPALNHKNTEIQRQDATCTENGYIKRVCVDCGATVEETTLDALGHDWQRQEDKNNKAATCTENGQEKQKCSRCNAEQTAILDALGHALTEFADVKGQEPTCEKAGKRERHCTRDNCTEKEVIDVPALGHDWDKVIIVNGNILKHCKRCLLDETKPIDQTKYKTVTDNYTGISMKYYSEDGTFADGASPVLSIEPASTENKYLNKDYQMRTAYTIKVLVDGEEVEPNGPVTITIPASEGFNVNRTVIYYIDQSSIPDRIYDVEVNGANLVFETSDIGTFILVNEDDASIETDCECICHSDNWFLKIMYGILRFFWQLFRTNQVCECGALHY